MNNTVGRFLGLFGVPKIKFLKKLFKTPGNYIYFRVLGSVGGAEFHEEDHPDEYTFDSHSGSRPAILNPISHAM